MSTLVAERAKTQRLITPLEIGCLVLLIALFVYKGLLPAWYQLNSDFPNYYLVARLLHEHYAMDRIYDWIWLQRVKDHWAIPQTLVGFVGLTPFSALPLWPLAGLGALAAKRIWLVANFAVLAGSVLGIARLSGLRVRVVTLISFLAIIPLRTNFLLGQMHLVVLGLLVLALWLYTRNRWLSCSFVLAVAASLKVYPAFFAIYFLRKRQFKPAIALVALTLALLALCFFIFGAPLMRVFLLEQFPRMLRGEATDPFSLSAPSGSSLLHRLFLRNPLANPDPIVSSPLLYSLLYPLLQLGLLSAALAAIPAKVGDAKQTGIEWAAWICLLLTLSTEPATYHRVVLILAAAIALGALGSRRLRLCVLLFYFIACNVRPAVVPEHRIAALLLDFIPYWATAALFGCMIVALYRRRAEYEEAERAVNPWLSARVAWSVAGFAIVWCAVSAGTFVHAGTLEGSEFVMDRGVGAFARFAPQVVGGELLTIDMRIDGYRAEDEQGRRLEVAQADPGADQLAIASSPNSDRVWIEAAGADHSRLLEISTENFGVRNGPNVPVASIEDGESPALAPDGRELVFLREQKGAGSAWRVRLDQDGRVLAQPERISPAGVDVRGVGFDADQAVLSVADSGSSSLVRVASGDASFKFGAGRAATMIPARRDAGAVRIVQQFSGGYWRLFAVMPDRSQATQLTFADCNAYDPAWRGDSSLIYISDCGRGIGQGALAEIDFAQPKRNSRDPGTAAAR